MTIRHPSSFASGLHALQQDLLRAEGPQISTVRNYNFAILPYPPEDEFPLRQSIAHVTNELRDAGWNTGTVRLHSLLLARLRAEGPEVLASIVRREKSLQGAADRSRGLRMLKDRVVNLIDKPDGIAADVVREIEKILAEADGAGRTVIFLGRLGALYPFMRTSALLKHIDGRTQNAPVVLLYPGTVDGDGGLRFMGVMPPDRDYRPRIYR